MDRLNAFGRGLTDRIAILDTRGPGRLASRIRWLSVENFSGIKGDKTLNLHGFDVRGDKNTDTLRILLINHRPPIDPATGEFLDAAVVGANSTIELFQTKAGSDTMRHVRTYIHNLIETPNNVAWINDDSFVFTNDHSGKVGFVGSPVKSSTRMYTNYDQRRKLDAYVGGGSVGFCSRNHCNIAFSTGFRVPNGLVRGLDGLIYVPSTVLGVVDVFSIGQDHMLTKIDTIKIGMPIDNLSVDKNGDIFAACFPRLYKLFDQANSPFGVHPAASVYRIKRAGKGYQGIGRKGHLAGHDAEYEVELVMEDDGSVLPSATVVVHDAKTGRFFLGGVLSPFISICETR
jgi:arylesterase / paraoxonase